MDEKDCARVRELLIDARGDRDALPQMARDHLASCRACSAVLDVLSSLASPGPGAGAPTPDFRAADLALARARQVLRRRHEHMRLSLFVIAATSVAAAVAAAGALGYGIHLLAFQGLMVLGLPFVAYAALRSRTRSSTWTA